MALLTLDERKAIFKELGLGEYNKENIKAFQKKYLLRKKDYDGVYGTNTDNALRTVYYTEIYTKNFDAKEFRCECGGRYCSGYPDYMKPAELIHIQKIRDHYGKPITITCGLRDEKYNASLGGSVQNSLHLKGQAIDFYQSGVTDTLANRKKAVKWIKKQANHHYTYGDGINSSGYYVNAPYMGNALHTDTYDNVKPKHPTLKKSDKGTTASKPQKKPSTGVQKPSATTSDAKPKTYKPTTPYTGKIPAKVLKQGDDGDSVKNLQSFLNWAVGCKLNRKGHFRSVTEKYLKAWQKSRGLEPDGIYGAKSRKEAMKMVSEYAPKEEPKKEEPKKETVKEPEKKTLADKILDACKVQAEWMKNYVYNWVKWKPRNIEMSEKYGTCVTFVACVLQRLGYLKSGEYLWNNGKGFGTGKVYIWGKNGKRSVSDKDHMEVIYMGNKTLKSLKNKLKAGDIVMVDDNKSGESGSGGHIFILTGKWTEDGKPYIWDNRSADRIKGGKGGRHTYGSNRKVLAIVRPKET